MDLSRFKISSAAFTLPAKATLVATAIISTANVASSNALVPLQENTSFECYLEQAVWSDGRNWYVTPSGRLEDFVYLPHEDPGMLAFEQLVLEKLYWWSASAMRSPDKAPLYARRIYDQLMEMDKANAATQVLTNDLAMQNLVHKDFLLTVGYAILVIKETSALPTDQFNELIEFFVRRLQIPEYQRSDFYEARSCFAATDNPHAVGGCQNHTIGHQHLRALYGFVLGVEEEQSRGEAMYRFAVNDLMPDGALWREAQRGAYSWSYYSHALNNLLAIGDLFARNGTPIWDYANPRGQTIHDAVEFFVRSLQDPTNERLMWHYAVENSGMNRSHSLGSNPRSLERYDQVLERLWFTEWFPIYRSWFPDHPNTTVMSDLYTGAILPTHSYHTGFNTWCTMGGGLTE